MGDITAELEKATTGAQRASVINSIEKRYPKLRQHSKGPTFALTYGGTWRTLNETFGIPIKEAKQIEKEYHDLYVVSDDWVQARMKDANSTGYVELAFGLRLRTPGLSKIVWGSDSLPYEVKKEMKTAGNALGQSYGLLNSYSANMFMKRVWAHPKYRTQVLPCAQIHDSQYYLIRNTLGCIKWVNDNLVECMEWCELPEIKHPDVGLGSELEIYYPSWAEKHKVPNKASLKKIKEICDAIS
jgi:DNA polymerase-1